MKTRLIFFVLLLYCFLPAGNLPLTYTVRPEYHRIVIAVRGAVEWKEMRNGTSMQISLLGKPADFIVKNATYNFNDGTVKQFIMRADPDGSENIALQLRSAETEYKIFQEEGANRIIIDFYPQKKLIVKKKQEQPKAAPVLDIPKIALESGSNDTPAAAPAEVQKIIAAAEISVEPKIPNTLSAGGAFGLVGITFLVLALGTGSLMYVFILKHRRSEKINGNNRMPAVKFEENLARATEVVQRNNAEPVKVHSGEWYEEERDEEHAEEETLRMQGEAELRAWFEKSEIQMIKKNGAQLVKNRKENKTEKIITAKKLGVSVGELDLAANISKLKNKKIDQEAAV
ncbi:MAG: hypothetical protein H3C35_00990 [Bacteroidetes bacterium]|nr:hypothetical protein [Bacteroidota bacterium]